MCPRLRAQAARATICVLSWQPSFQSVCWNRYKLGATWKRDAGRGKREEGTISESLSHPRRELPRPACVDRARYACRQCAIEEGDQELRGGADPISRP